MTDGPTSTPAKPRARSWLLVVLIGAKPGRTLVRIAILALGSFIAFKYVLLPIRVTGISMLPTYADRSVNFINTLAYLRHGPRRGDVVGVRLTPGGFWSPPQIMFLKRVVGLPGETLEFNLGHVVVNGTPLEEPYEKLPSNWRTTRRTPVSLGPAQYFIVGDNRTMPPADHFFGVVGLGQVVGKAVR